MPLSAVSSAQGSSVSMVPLATPNDQVTACTDPRARGHTPQSCALEACRLLCCITCGHHALPTYTSHASTYSHWRSVWWKIAASAPHNPLSANPTNQARPNPMPHLRKLGETYCAFTSERSATAGVNPPQWCHIVCAFKQYGAAANKIGTMRLALFTAAPKAANVACQPVQASEAQASSTKPDIDNTDATNVWNLKVFR